MSAPTCSTWAKALPLTIKLPESRLSPGCFKMGSLSPVMRDSLTSHSPAATTASEQIWLPAESAKMSSSTTSSTGISLFCPSRSTTALGAETMESLSKVRLARMLWKEPMKMLARITPKNTVLRKEPTRITAKARAKFKILKKVRTFSRMIWPSVFVWMAALPLCRPWRVRWRTCSSERPAWGSGWKRSAAAWRRDGWEVGRRVVLFRLRAKAFPPKNR